MSDTQHPSDRDRDDPVLARADQRFVARVGDAWRMPPLSPERRTAFQAKLDARIESRRTRVLLRALAGAAVAAAAAWLVVARPDAGTGDPDLRIASAGDVRAAESETAAEAILELSAEDDGEDESLPDDYAAIASLFLDS